MMRIGLIGAGYVSDFHLDAWHAVPGAQVVTICDPDRARAAARAERHKIGAVHESLAQMCRDERLDALDIASPRQTHSALVRQAARLVGVPLLCEKPLAPSFAEAQSLAEDLGSRVRLMVNENWRFRPVYRTVKVWIEAGALGTIRQVSMATRSSALLPGSDGNRPAIMRQPFMAQERRLIVAELLTHHLDVLRWLLGPLRVRAAWTAATQPDLPGETAASVALESASGVAVFLEGTMTAPGAPPRATDRLEIIGDLATMHVEGAKASCLGRQTAEAVFDQSTMIADSFHAAIAHFASCLESGDRFETDISDNLETLRLVDAVYSQAAHHG